MNIIDAINSKRRFRRRRPHETSWCFAWDQDGQIKLEPHDWPGPGRGGCIVSVADILADDWEVEPVMIGVTDVQFYEACAAALKECGMQYYGPNGPRTGVASDSEVLSSLGRRLGFMEPK